MIARVGAVVLLAVLGHGPAPASAAPSVAFRLSDSRLDEASGIARGITSPGVFYVQNDSGDSARFFALDARTGRVRAVFTVPGAQNHDWEDIAVAPDARGVASVWLADIGDNDGVRSEVQLYRVDEPRVDMTRRDVTARTAAPDVWRLRYPNGPVNAESLAVSPHGRAYVVTKADNGRSVVYAVPREPDANRVQRMTRIGAITFHAHASLIPADLQVLATGAALSADGSVFAVRTYTDAYIWRVRGGDVAAALRTSPVRVILPLQPQGEGVCVVGASLVVDSEGVGSQVYRVPLPTVHSARQPPSRAPPSRVAHSSSSSSQPASTSTHRSGSVPFVLGAVAIGALGVVLVAVWRRRRRG